MPPDVGTLFAVLTIAAALGLILAWLTGHVRRLHDRVEAALAIAREARSDVAVLSKAVAYDREELQAARRHIDTLADHVARLEGTPEEKAIAVLSQPPRI
jgi:ubiquinone biosynthesis protein UbiJ